jgi:2-polyprenyl-3-methyl-5-hydroxy-6-metoxy-1,4-benzoquinol methylase
VVLTEERERIAAIGWDVAAQPLEHVECCNLCGARTFVTLTHEDRYGYPFKAVACSVCGLVCLNPRLTPGAYDRFYRAAYRRLVSAYHGRLIDASSVEAEQAGYAAALAALLEPYLRGWSGGTLLDVGGSTGVVAGRLCSAYDLEGTVLDPAPDELARAASRGLKTIAGRIEEFDPGARRFDVVLLCQTLDHVLDAAGALGKLRKALAPDGLLFVDVVDFRAAYLRGWNVEKATKVDHPYYFTEQTIEAMLARAGLAVAGKDYAADHLHVGYVCRPGSATDALPEAAWVSQQLRELRFVQNAPGPR